MKIEPIQIKKSWQKTLIFKKIESKLKVVRKIAKFKKMSNGLNFSKCKQTKRFIFQ